MNRSNRVLAHLLTYAGVIPFFLCMLGAYGLGPVTECVPIIRGYSTVILAFLSGLPWAYALLSPSAKPAWLLVTSNLFALLACAGLLFADAATGLSLTLLCLISLLALDLWLKDHGVIPRWFFLLRLQATFMVVFFMVLILTSGAL